MSAPLVSVLINNYNYGRFLGAAIESALKQDYSPIEVVVVDDGSTDNSADVIKSFGDRIIPVFKKNGGQGSAFNAGVAASHGEILCFLDSDDFYSPNKVTSITKAFDDNDLNAGPSLVYHWVTETDEFGKPLGPAKDTPKDPIKLNLYQYAERYHDVYYCAGPTSTLSINQKLASLIFPIPEVGSRISADEFIVRGAALLGCVYNIPKGLSFYRFHGGNSVFRTKERTPSELRDLLQNYLNAKLVDIGLQPVIRWKDSMYAADELLGIRQWHSFGRLLLRETLAHPDWHTLSYTLRFSKYAAKTWIKDRLLRK